MALTAPKVAEIEHFDSPQQVDAVAAQLAALITKSKHFIVFTGAGVSTSAGIPDFRGPTGAWTLRAQGKEIDYDSTQTLRTIPSPTHMALVELQNRGILKLLVSQNCDGLHRRSGVRAESIAELHGNSNLERCQKCIREYLRDFRAVSSYAKSLKDHRTGRKCAICGGALLDTIINFGEDLPERAFSLADAHAKKADLCLVLGSSLRVTPADSIPRTVGKRKGAKLAICNLQETPQDDLASIRIHTKVDDLMTRVMEKLGLPIPSFIVRRFLVIHVDSQGEERHQIRVTGVDSDGTPASFLKSFALKGSRRPAREEPFTLPLRQKLDQGASLVFELEFMGHYGEPNLTIDHTIGADAREKSSYALEYDPRNGCWTCTSYVSEDFGERQTAVIVGFVSPSHKAALGNIYRKSPVDSIAAHHGIHASPDTGSTGQIHRSLQMTQCDEAMAPGTILNDDDPDRYDNWTNDQERLANGDDTVADDDEPEVGSPLEDDHADNSSPQEGDIEVEEADDDEEADQKPDDDDDDDDDGDEHDDDP